MTHTSDEAEIWKVVEFMREFKEWDIEKIGDMYENTFQTIRTVVEKQDKIYNNEFEGKMPKSLRRR